MNRSTIPGKEENTFTVSSWVKSLEGLEALPEAEKIGWFYRDQLPPLSDGHEPRINYGFDFLENPQLPPYFE